MSKVIKEFIIHEMEPGAWSFRNQKFKIKIDNSPKMISKKLINGHAKAIGKDIHDSQFVLRSTGAAIQYSIIWLVAIMLHAISVVRLWQGGRSNERG
ncbi:hypothetical protein A2U01_0001182 [Trifolium medium]|uniref:Uncharacterized protein n=1 Tax=Trifolium medium TaxID=97028 RepID=A0A392M1D1_9FABA|nr:hypothetical protein [Trifolium medium]